MEKTNIGIIGCGNISAFYLNTLRSFDHIAVKACADLIPGQAKAKAEEFGIPSACFVEELLADPEIEMVVNLTVPQAHTEISLAALKSGKHVYSEKPLALTRQDGELILRTAQEKGLRVGCAPDTVLGGAFQTCRKLVDEGLIGEPVAAMAFMLTHGPEDWHPDPDFFYQEGAGPLFDMGPYYLTALCNLIGPVKSVSAMARATFPERVITSEPKNGQRIEVNTSTHVAALLEFANGAIATMVNSFDVWEPYNPWMVVHGTHGTLEVPDANMFDGTVRLRLSGEEAAKEIPLTHGYTDNNWRGIGVADMVQAIRLNQPHRATGEMGYHVLDSMHAILESAECGQLIGINSTCEQPASLPPGAQNRTGI